LNHRRAYPGFCGLFEREMESPCTRICALEPGAGLCLGCGRTLQEIAAWGTMNDQERRRIMAELPARLAKLKRD
jgi:predicted Fe-S protein YdhL (DUF1289 family)